MLVTSTLLVIPSRDQMRAALQFGFEREGIQVAVGEVDSLAETVAEVRPELVITGAASEKEALEVLGTLRDALAEADLDPPVLHVGNGVNRERAIEEGASEVVGRPVFVRDVVTLGRLVAGRRDGRPVRWTGKLSEHFGLFYLVRAISVARKRCVLSLIRGLRRGELRFHDGEVTSAQVGVLTGIAALHQLLLWTDANFELRPEEIVPWRQIPLDPVAVIEASERFLEEVREEAGSMSPSHVYEESREVASEVLASVPAEIGSVLRLFTGRRTLADVIEDSPYRTFETLRIATRLRDAGIITLVEIRAQARATPGLGIERWLSGVEPEAKQEEAPAGGKKKRKRRRRRKKRADSGAAETKPADKTVDWSDVMPSKDQANHESMSQVVPATSATGEVESDEDGRPLRTSGEVEASTQRGPAVHAEGASSIQIDPSVIDEAEAEEKRKAEEAAEAKRKAEEEAAAEAKRKAEEEEAKRKAEEEAAAEAKRKAEEEAAAEAKRKAEEEAAAEAKRKAEEEAAEAKRKAEEEAAAEAKRKAEEEEAKRKAEEEAAAEAKRKAEEEEAKRKAEEEAAAEAKRQAEEEAAAEAKRQAEEEAAKKAKKKKKKKKKAKKAKKADKDKAENTAAASDRPAKTRPETEDGFSAAERAFFAAGAELDDQDPEPVESFDDLDEGYELPKTLWDRLKSDPTGPRKKPDDAD